MRIFTVYFKKIDRRRALLAVNQHIYHFTSPLPPTHIFHLYHFINLPPHTFSSHTYFSAYHLLNLIVDITSSLSFCKFHLPHIFCMYHFRNLIFYVSFYKSHLLHATHLPHSHPEDHKFFVLTLTHLPQTYILQQVFSLKFI